MMGWDQDTCGILMAMSRAGSPLGQQGIVKEVLLKEMLAKGVNPDFFVLAQPRPSCSCTTMAWTMAPLSSHPLLSLLQLLLNLGFILRQPTVPLIILMSEGTHLLSVTRARECRNPQEITRNRIWIGRSSKKFVLKHWCVVNYLLGKQNHEIHIHNNNHASWGLCALLFQGFQGQWFFANVW